MNTASSYEMTTSLGAQIPLVKTSIRGELRDTALETTVIQHYLNNEPETIEAVYTFPLPAGATLLSLEVNLNGEVLAGTVVASQKAEEAYEDVITDGDSALLLQKIDETLYTLNMGNLQPEDSAIISIRYIQLLCWQQNTLRIMYPTTIGNRYGQPAGLGLQPHQVTHEDPGVEHRADFSLQVLGQLAGCAAACPSHSLSIRSENEQLLITSDPNGLVMDRDIVISLQRAETSMGCAGYFDRDLDGKWVAWLTLNPDVSNAVQQRNVTIIVDCSGSMSGISNQQAKIAVREIVEQLGQKDMFNIVKFGSHATALFPEPLPGNEANKTAALKLIADMNADMGGTEIGTALQLAYTSAKGMRDAGDILLITDGQSYDVGNVVKKAKKSGIRHFTIGVGSAVAEDMVQGLAEATGGAHELVSPNENMAEAIIRHVKRSYAARLTKASITWPTKPALSIPKTITHAFSGDTVNLFARFDTKPEGQAVIQLKFDDQTWTQSIPMSAYSESNADSTLQELRLARVCAARQIQLSNNDAEKQSLGIQYQLQTTKTSYLLIAKRKNKDDSVTGPVIRQIPQMSKANGGVVFVHMDAMRSQRTASNSHASSDRGSAEEHFDIPAFLRRQADDSLSISSSDSSMSSDYEDYDFAVRSDPRTEEDSPETFAFELNIQFQGIKILGEGEFPSDLDDLSFRIDKNLLEILRSLCSADEPWDESDVIAIFLYIFAKHSEASTGLERTSTRAITKAYKKRAGLERLEAKIWDAFNDARVGEEWRLKNP